MKLFNKQEDEFYKSLREAAKLVCESGELLQVALMDPASYVEKMDELVEIEHKADDVTRGIIMKLHKTLVTPMDREDIFLLATTLDDVVDFVQGALGRMIMYKTGTPLTGAQELVRLLNECMKINEISFAYLSNIKGKTIDIMENAQKVSKLESEGDRVYRTEVAKLFEEEKNPIEIIKWKEILEQLEDALDKCEVLSNLLKGVVLKYA